MPKGWSSKRSTLVLPPRSAYTIAMGSAPAVGGCPAVRSAAARSREGPIARVASTRTTKNPGAVNGRRGSDVASSGRLPARHR